MRGVTWLGLWAAAAAFACGSSTGIELFGRTGGDSGGNGGERPQQGGAGETTGSTSSSGTTSSTSSSSSSSSSSTSSSSSSSSSTTSTSTSSSGSTSSSSSGGPEIPCVNQTCVGGNVCCYVSYDKNQSKCAPPGQCYNAAELWCNGANDCPQQGQICCGHYIQNVGYQKVECTWNCYPNGQNEYAVEMCHDDPEACEDWQECVQSGSLPDGFLVCKN